MKIEKYKFINNGKYKVTIDNKEYDIYEDILLKYNILTKEQITTKDLEELLKDNKKYEAYYQSIKYLKTKLRTEKEINNYLQKLQYNTNEIDFTIAKLKQDNYLNETLYTKAYIMDSINLKNIGPIKIKQNLLILGIDKKVVEEQIKTITKEQIDNKIKKYIEKIIKTNNNKSSYEIKNKIKMNLFISGFSEQDINEILKNYEFDDKEIYKKEYEKLYNKLSKKYQGNTLELKIKQQLYQRGFR